MFAGKLDGLSEIVLLSAWPNENIVAFSRNINSFLQNSAGIFSSFQVKKYGSSGFCVPDNLCCK